MSAIPEFSHERVLTAQGARSGLVITVALHSSALGPALGGCRMWTYPTWADGQADALRLYLRIATVDRDPWHPAPTSYPLAFRRKSAGNAAGAAARAWSTDT